MAMVVEALKNTYNYLLYDLCDDRTKDMFPAPWVIILLMPFYVYFSLRLGPRLMQNVKPFDLRTIIFWYNIFQIVISFYILFLAFKGGWFNGYSFTCQPVDMTENIKSRAMINATWWYTLVKLIDLMDTVFFVLRKKERQISFLHVFHHYGMPHGSYLLLKYYPNGHATLVGVFNCIVHIVMYTYYLISGLGPDYQKYLWWKKHLTTMQIVQFSIFFIHSLVALCDSTCSYPKWILTLICIHSLQFIYMFGSFYYINYIKESGKAVNENGVNGEIFHKISKKQ